MVSSQVTIYRNGINDNRAGAGCADVSWAIMSKGEGAASWAESWARSNGPWGHTRPADRHELMVRDSRSIWRSSASTLAGSADGA